MSYREQYEHSLCQQVNRLLDPPKPLGRMGEYLREHPEYDPPGTPLGLTKEIHTEESVIFEKLIKMTYEDMFNGAMEEL